jgi:hypothetical protein
MVECSKELVDTMRYPVGTKFRLKVKLTDRGGGGEYLFSSYKWSYNVITEDEFARLHAAKERAT